MAIQLPKDFIETIAVELSPILSKLDRYRKMAVDYKDHLELNAKMLGEANKEQPAWYAYYDEKRVELYHMSHFTEMCVDRVKGKLWTILQKNNQYSATKADLEYEVKSNDDYFDFYKIQLEVDEVYMLYCSIVKSFEQRGYTLKNLTEIRVHSMDHDVL